MREDRIIEDRIMQTRMRQEELMRPATTRPVMEFGELQPADGLSLTPCFSWVIGVAGRLSTVLTVCGGCGKPLKRFKTSRDTARTPLKQGVTESRLTARTPLKHWSLPISFMSNFQSF